MDWKELVMYVLESEKKRQELLSTVTSLKSRRRTLDEELREAMPWNDESRSLLSRTWSLFFGSGKPERQAREALKAVSGQLDPAESELKSLEAKLAQEARDYLLRNQGFDEAYDTARHHYSYLNNLTYGLNSLYTYAEEALRDVTHAKQNYEYSQKPGWGTDGWWLTWGEGWLRGAKKEVGAFASYSALVQNLSAYLPKEAQALEQGIKLCRMLDLDHIEQLSKPLAHLTEFEQSVANARKALRKNEEMYRRKMDRQVQQFLARIREGAF